MYDSRTNLSKDVGAEIEKYFENKMFSTIIPRSIRLSEAPSHGLSIFEYSPDSTGGVAYENLTKEIINRFVNTSGRGDNKMERPNLLKSE